MGTEQHLLFSEVIETFGPPLQRLVKSYERDAHRQADLFQEVLVALFRALEGFEQRSSLRTFVYRVAHNVAASHCIRSSRLARSAWISLDELEEPADAGPSPEREADHKQRLEKLNALVLRLKPLDRQLTLLFLEGLSPAEIAEVTGLSSSNVSTKLSRLRAALRDRLGGSS